MKHAAEWIQTARPKTLIAAFLPIAGAFVLALSKNMQVNYLLCFSALAAAFCVQIATNLWNDYFDHKKGSDTKERIGPQRILHKGLVDPPAIFKAALLFDLLALIAAIPIVYEFGFIFLILGLVCVLMSILYTAGPFALAYLGLGEVFVFVFFGCIATYFSYFVMTSDPSPSAWILGFIIGFLSCVLITVNNLRDYEEDKKNKKRTLVVLLGKYFGRGLLFLELLLPYCLSYYWIENKSACWILFLASPLALIIFWGMALKPMTKDSNRFLALSALHALLFISLWSVGVLI